MSKSLEGRVVAIDLFSIGAFYIWNPWSVNNLVPYRNEFLVRQATMWFSVSGTKLWRKLLRVREPCRSIDIFSNFWRNNTQWNHETYRHVTLPSVRTSPYKIKTKMSTESRKLLFCTFSQAVFPKLPNHQSHILVQCSLLIHRFCTGWGCWTLSPQHCRI